jgi:hypothetical protein
MTFLQDDVPKLCRDGDGMERKDLRIRPGSRDANGTGLGKEQAGWFQTGRSGSGNFEVHKIICCNLTHLRGCKGIHLAGDTPARRRPDRYLVIEPAGVSPTVSFMGKSKNPATGEGFLGEIMVHKLSRAIGIVEGVTEAKAGWPPQITLKLKDGSYKKGRLSDFREPSGNEREKFSAA